MLSNILLHWGSEFNRFLTKFTDASRTE